MRARSFRQHACPIRSATTISMPCADRARPAAPHLARRGDRRGVAAALRHSRMRVDLMREVDPEMDRLLLGSG
jgi:hypothetical protein